MTWPIYTGGKVGAAQRLREAELTGAKAELLGTEEQLNFQLVARHFGLRLAVIVEGLRQTQLGLDCRASCWPRQCAQPIYLDMVADRLYYRKTPTRHKRNS